MECCRDQKLEVLVRSQWVQINSQAFLSALPEVNGRQEKIPQIMVIY